MRRDPECMQGLGPPRVPVDCSQQVADLLRLDDRGMMLDPRNGEGATQDVGWIALGPQGGKTIAKDTAGKGA